MVYAAIALALLGFAIGAAFRLGHLLAMLVLLLVLLLVLSVAFAIAYHLSLFDSALLIMAVQAIVQASYFLGLVVRKMLTDHRGRPLF
jgi:hypothetical protein